jgi:glycosyltransferase involved in cell wall biosynthesis
MPEGSTISVIVATYNWPEALQAVVEGLFRQTDLNFEIIIADDGSGAATRDCVAALQPRSPVPMQHVWQPDDGFRLSMARNRGILASSGTYLLFLDGDCIPQRNYIEQHRRLARPGFMLTGSRILLNPDTTSRVLSGKLHLPPQGAMAKLGMRLRGQIGKLPQLLWTLPDIGRASKRFSFRRIKGCNLGAWRSDLERVNGFDESFCGWGYEDADLVARLFNAGVMRKDGAYATEVLHLWHRNAPRDRASSNQRVVEQRLADKTTQATHGLREHAAGYTVPVTERHRSGPSSRDPHAPLDGNASGTCR